MTSTPRPWTWEEEPNGMTFGIWHDDDTNIGEVLDADDAAVLVQAVNAHDDLVAALIEIFERTKGEVHNRCPDIERITRIALASIQ